MSEDNPMHTGITDWAVQSKLWAYVDRRKADDCWHWRAGKTSAGYGALTINGKQQLAHRIACATVHGPPTPENPFALHSCDNRTCCNPRHLRWGTQKQNVADAMNRNRASAPPRNTDYRRRDTQPKGEKVWNSGLTEDGARRAWRMHLGGANSRQIAEALGVSRNSVIELNRGRTWRHLTDAPSIEELKAGGVRRGSNGFNDLAKIRALQARKAKG